MFGYSKRFLCRVLVLLCVVWVCIWLCLTFCLVDVEMDTAPEEEKQYWLEDWDNEDVSVSCFHPFPGGGSSVNSNLIWVGVMCDLLLTCALPLIELCVC